MYTLRIIKKVIGGRYVNLYIESYVDVAVALRVALIRSKDVGTLVLVQRPNGDIITKFGLEVY